MQQITAGQDLELYAYATSMDEIEAMLMRGEIKAALVISPGFAADMQALKGMPMQIIIDGIEPESGGFAVEHIAARAEEFISTALAGQLAAQGFSVETLQPIDLRIRTWFNPDLKPRNDLIPGLLSMVLGFPALSVALTLAHEREHGTLEQLLATPIGRTDLLLGKIIPYILVGLINVIIIPIFAIAWFGISFNGNFASVFRALGALHVFHPEHGHDPGCVHENTGRGPGCLVSGDIFPRFLPDRYLLPDRIHAGNCPPGSQLFAGHALRHHYTRRLFAGRWA